MSDFLEIYVVISAVIGVLGGVAIWLAAIRQSGIALGGSLGLIPAWIGAWIVAAGWPLIAAFLIARPAREWLVDIANAPAPTAESVADLTRRMYANARGKEPS